MKSFLYLTVFLIAVGAVATSFAADDPSIKGETRTNTQKAMSDHIDQNTYQGNYIVYDAVTGKLLRLRFKELHKGIVRKDDFYVSCADFTDDQGKKYDLDFLVIDKGGNFEVYEAIVHKVDGDKRKYDLED